MYRLKLFDDSEVIPIVDDILGHDRAAREAARARLWPQVELYVMRVAHIPLGRLSDDPDVRRDIFVLVMDTLEANHFARLGAWRARRLHNTDRSSFWGLVRVTTYHRSIDYARAHPHNIAPRSKPYCWVREHTTPPCILDDSLPSMPFLAHCTTPALYDYLERFQDMLRAPPTPPPVSIPDPVLPEGSGKGRR
jgi:hypothetical protein